MRDSLREWFYFLNAMRKHWGALVTGGTLIGALSIWQGLGHSIKPWMFWFIAATGVIGAIFLAWKDERLEATKQRELVEHERTKHSDPQFLITLDQINVSFDKGRNITYVLISSSLTNHGGTSAASGWKLNYNSPAIGVTTPYINLPLPTKQWFISPQSALLLHNDRMLPVIAAEAVEHGHTKSGRLLFELPGDLTHAITTHPHQLFIGCGDRTGKYIWQAATSDNILFAFLTLPGEHVVSIHAGTDPVPLLETSSNSTAPNLLVSTWYPSTHTERSKT